MSSKNKFGYSPLIHLCILAATLTGCQTMSIIQAGSESRACAESVKSTPAYQIVARNWRTMIGLEEPTASELGNQNKPNADELTAFVTVHNDAAKCRGQAIEQYSKAAPYLIPVIVEAYRDADKIDGNLILGNITWGEANRLYMLGKRDSKQKIITIMSQQAEIEKRAANQTVEIAGTIVKGVFAIALIALDVWTQEQSARANYLQTIHPMYRPITTRCTASQLTQSFSCSSY